MELAFLTPLLKDSANGISRGVTINNKGVIEMGFVTALVSYYTSLCLPFCSVFTCYFLEVSVSMTCDREYKLHKNGLPLSSQW